MPIVFHGTSDIFLERIKKTGLCAAGTSGNIQTFTEGAKFYRKDTLYTSPLQTTAWSIAEQAAYHLGGNPIVLGFSTNRFKDRGPGCRVQKKSTEHNFIGCKCVPVEILRIQDEKPRDEDIIRGELYKHLVGEWKEL